MVTSNSQFEINLLQEFYKAGGPISTLDQLDKSDTRRPFIQAEFIQGFNKNYTGPVTIELSNILANEEITSRIYQQNCYEYSCILDSNYANPTSKPLFREGGLETSVEGVSNICFSKWNVNTDANPIIKTNFVDRNVFPRLYQPECVVQNNRKKFLLRATVDQENSAYVADIGHLNLLNNNFSIIEPNVPFSISNQITKLRATTILDVPVGIKFAIIKRVTKSSITNIGIVYGELNQQFYFPHELLESNRPLTKEGQSISLENLSINLMMLLSIKEFEGKPNQTVYRARNFSSPQTENTILNSAKILRNLINQDFSSSKGGTVPEFITTYSNSYKDYNSEADLFYTQDDISCFEQDCFESNCFATFKNESLLNRSINNRALCWLVQFFVAYSNLYSEKSTYINNIFSIISYLLSQRDPKTKLFYKGWIDTNQELGYDNSLKLDSTIDCSTNCAIFLALLKVFEITQDFSYLQEALNLYKNIDKYFLNQDNLFVHSIKNKKPSIESVTYQLLLTKSLEDYKYIQEVSDFFISKLQAIKQTEDFNVILSNGDDVVLTNDNLVVVPEVLDFINDTTNVHLFNPTESDTYSSYSDIFKYNYLIRSTLLSIDSNLLLPFINQIEEKEEIIYSKTVKERNRVPFVFLLERLIDQRSLVELEATKINSYQELNSLKFGTEYNFNNLLKNMPTDYGWFKPEVLNKKSNLGKLLYSISAVMGKAHAQTTFLSKMSNIDYLYGSLLNAKAKDFGVTRFIKESDTSLKERIKNEIINRSSTKIALEEKMELYDSPIHIKDNAIIISSFETEEPNPFVEKWNEGLLQGRRVASSNIATALFNQPLEPDVKTKIEQIKPAGIKFNYVEAFTFNIGEASNQQTGFKFTNINGGCDNLDLENSDDYKLETSSRICLEDEESIIDTGIL